MFRTLTGQLTMAEFTSAMIESIKAHELWAYWAWRHIRRQYERSVLGPLWITMAMAIYALGLNMVFGRLFGVNADRFVPWVTCGAVAWYFICGLLNEASDLFLSNRGYILQSDRPLLVYFCYLLTKNLLVYCHHLIAAVGVLLYFNLFHPFNIVLLMLFLPLFLFSVGWVAVVISIVSTRYRDIPPIIGNLLQVAFFITPVMFMPDMLRDLELLLDLNPLAQWINLLREPLMGRLPGSYSVAYCVGSGCVGWTAAILLYGRAARRVAYWL